MPKLLFLSTFSFTKLQILCILIVLNISSAYAADNAEDYAYTDAPDSVDEASGVNSRGLYQATTPLQKRADAARAFSIDGLTLKNNAPRGTMQTQEYIDAETKRSRAMQDATQAEDDRTASPLFGHSSIADISSAAHGVHMSPNEIELAVQEPLADNLAIDTKREDERRMAVSQSGEGLEYLVLPALLAIIGYILFRQSNKGIKESYTSALPAEPSNRGTPTKTVIDESFDAKLHAFTVFLDWQESHVEKREGKVFFKSHTTRVLYFNFALGAIDQLANTSKTEKSASEFMETMGSTLAATLFASEEEAIKQASSYGVSDDKNIITANELGHEAMGIALNIETTPRTMSFKGYMLHDLLASST